MIGSVVSRWTGGRAAFRPRVVAAALAATLLGGGVLAQDLPQGRAPGAVPQQDDVASAAAEAAAPARPSRSSSFSLRDLGVDYEITLRGVEGRAGVPLSVRTDQVVDHATLHLKYSWSPALLPDLSHLRVTVNDVTVATLPVPRELAGQVVESEVEIDPRLIIDYNRINLQLIGHYTHQCEDPDHTSLWANIDSASYVELGWSPLRLSNDLALLPVPFFDTRDSARLELPFVFAGEPGPGVLEPAGIVASWFGALAGYRGGLFPAMAEHPPITGNAVVVATTRNPPAGLDLPQVSGPALAVIDNPNDDKAKLLLVLGRDEAELAQAATALVLGTPLSGPLAMVEGLDAVQPRVPYDAPNWLPSNRPVRMSELVQRPGELSVRGYHPDLIRIGLQLPPDLFVWKTQGIPVDLRYRYTLPEGVGRSALNISINDAFVSTLPLDGKARPSSLGGRLGNLLQPVGEMPIRQKLVLPTGPFSANSQLRFHFFFDRPQADECRSTFPDVSAAIDGDSTIDLSGFHHYMAMPDLAAFGNAGFPFTRMADLAETALVLPDRPTSIDLGNALTLLGRMGASTGYPALNTRIISPAQVGQHADRDLLVLGSPRNQPLYADWRGHLPLGDAGQGQRLRLTDWLVRRVPQFLSPDARRTDLPTTAEVTVALDAGDVVLMGFESPLRARRSVVAVLAEDPSRVGGLFEAWLDPDRLREFQGSVVLVQGERVRSLVGDQGYYVGHLPRLTWLRWYFSHSPLLLAGAVMLATLLLALLLRWLLRRHARARLPEPG